MAFSPRISPSITDFGDESHQKGDTGLTVQGAGFGFAGTLWVYTNSDRTGTACECTIGPQSDIELSNVAIPAGCAVSTGTRYLFYQRNDLAWSFPYAFTLNAAVAGQSITPATESDRAIELNKWYVRPSTTPGTYGNEDGTSYANAWNGFANITWGVGGVVAGDTLYVCGSHTTQTLAIGASGTSGNVITVRGDYPGDAGSVSRDSAIAVNMAGRDYITVTEISVYTTTSQPAFYVPSAQNLTFANVDISEAGSHGYALVGGDGSSHSDYLFSGGSIKSCSQYGIRWLVSATNATSTLTNITLSGVEIDGCTLGGIEFRTESDVNDASIMTNITVTDNTITGNGGNGIRISHGRGILAEGADLTVTGNTVTGNGTGTSGGGIGLVGFGPSAGTWGSVTIQDNNASSNSGPAGGIVLGYCQYARLSENTCSNNTVTGSTIDGCGIDIDDGNEDVEVWQNTLSGNTGSTVENSGIALMILDNKRVTAWANRGTGNKRGARISGTFASTTIEVVSNVFAECADDGLQINRAQTSVIVKNNIFTGAAGNTGYKVDSVPGDSTDEDYNCFAGTWNGETDNHTLGSNTIDTEPLLDANLRPRNDLLVGAGVAVVGITTDYEGNTYSDPPTIGAFEMVGLLDNFSHTGFLQNVGRMMG